MTVLTGRLQAFPSLSRRERRRWTDYYENQLHKQLIQTIQHVRESNPSQLIMHLDSILTLLRRARPRPKFHPLAVELIEELHPWPLRWLRWDAWEQEIRFAIQVHTDARQPRQRAAFLGHLAEILFNTGRMDEALTIGQEALGLARDHRAAKPIAIASVAVIKTLLEHGHRKEAHGIVKTLLEEIDEARTASPPEKTLAMARLELQKLKFLRRNDRLKEAMTQAHRIIAQLEALPETDEHLLAVAYRDRATMAWAKGNCPEAVQDAKKAIQMFAEQGDLFAETKTRGNLGLIYWTMTKLDLAEKGIRRVISMAERLNAHWHLTYALGNLGLVYLVRGEMEEAQRYFNRALDVARKVGDVKEINRSKINRAVTKIYLSKLEEARRELESGLTFYEEQGYSEPIMTSCIRLSYCYANLGQERRALEMAQRALSMAREVNDVVMEIDAMRCLAELQLPNQRANLLRQALPLARQKEQRLDAAACLLQMAELAGEKEEKLALWNEGVQILEKIGATAWLEGHSPDNPPRIIT
jgi:tetratricopeptide (TPR) repeat protein